MTDGFASIIEQLERQKAAIERALAALRDGCAFEPDHVFEAGALGDGDGRVGHAGIFIADVFNEEEDEDVVLVLAGVHATAQFVAALPEGAVEFRFFEGHYFRRMPIFASIGVGESQLQLNRIVRSVCEILFRPEIPLRRLNRRMP